MQASTHPDTDARQRFSDAARTFSRPRRCHADMLLRFGQMPLLVCLRDGRVQHMASSLTPLPSWDFSVSGSAQAWCKFWEGMPQPGWHDIFAMSKRGEFIIEGNLHPMMTNLQFMKDLLAVGREGVA